MHSSICAGCGGPVGPTHVDAEEVSGVRELKDTRIEERSHNLGLLKETRTSVTYAWSELVRHRFTLCEACVRGVLRRAATSAVDQVKAPPAKTGSLAASLLVVPGILAGVTALMWTRDPSWVRWVTLAAIPVWCALVLVGDKAIDDKAAAHVRTKAAAPGEVAALDGLPWAEVLTRVDLTYLRESIARARRVPFECAVMSVLDQAAIDLSACPTDVIEVGVNHDPMATAARLVAAGIRLPGS